MISERNNQFENEIPCGRSIDESLIFLGVVGESVTEATRGTFSLSQLEDIVKKAAVHWGAGDHLLAMLLCKLPSMLKELQLLPAVNEESKTFLHVKTQYRIWTKGECEIVKDITKYEAEKNSFDFWIDRDEKKSRPLKKKLANIGPKAVDLLIYLVERLGERVSKEQLLRDVWGEEVYQDIECERSQQNKIELQLTKLEQFCGGKFRQHLFSKKFEKGIGLNSLFKNSYFIFERLG